MSLQDTTIKLTGLQLLKLLREFSKERCDTLGLQGYDGWPDVVEHRQEDEESFSQKLEELRTRGHFESLTAAKEFVSSVCSGDRNFFS